MNSRSISKTKYSKTYLNSTTKFVLDFLEEESVPNAVIPHNTTFYFSNLATNGVVERVLRVVKAISKLYTFKLTNLKIPES